MPIKNGNFVLKNKGVRYELVQAVAAVYWVLTLYYDTILIGFDDL